MATFDWRHAPATEAAQALDTQADLMPHELHAALANAMERIAALERERDELGEVFRAFNEMMEASRLHGPGILDEQ